MFRRLPDGSSRILAIQHRLKHALVLIGLGVLRGLTVVKDGFRVFFSYGLGRPIVWVSRGLFRIGLLPMYKQYISQRQKFKTHPRLAGVRSVSHFVERYAVYAALVTLGVFALGNNIFARTIRPDEIGRGAIWTSYTNSENSDLIVETAAPTQKATERRALAVAVGTASAGTNSSTATNGSLDTSTMTNAPLAVGGALLGTDSIGTTDVVERTETITYTVTGGDTLSTIAHSFGLTSQTLVWANGLSDRDFIKPGQTLKIPPAEGYLYTIKKGDTLASVAKKYGGKVDTIVSTNHLASDSDISVGDQIVIPGGQPPAPVITPTRNVASNIYNGVSSNPPPSAKATGAKFIWPTTHHRINQYFRGRYHTGVDIDGDTGNPIYAAAAGRVIYAAYDRSGYGLHVVIDHGNGYETLYGHASKIYVSKGDYVKQGQTIAALGSTGRSTGPHLHFEVRYGGGFLNPLSFF